jgi:thiol-disulfide isomerase/thioredoxin
MAKKAASKSSPAPDKPEAEKKVVRPIHGFNILDDETQRSARLVQATLLDLAAMREKNPRPAFYTSAADFKQHRMPIGHPYLRYLMDNMGWSRNGLQQLVGTSGTGKTTKVLYDVGHIMMSENTPVLYLACEGAEKCMAPERMARCLHHDPEIAVKLLRAIHIEPCMALPQLMPKLRNWAAAWRNKAELPKDVTLIGIVDPYSRLMTEAEAAGSVVWDKIAKEEAFELGTGNNFGHAKYSAQFSRVLQGFCEMYNVCLFVVHQRTDKVDFAAGQAVSYMPEWLKMLNYLSKIGGHSLDGLAATTQVMVSTEKIKDPVLKRTTGKKVRVRILKQSHGADERTGWWELRTQHADDGGFLESPLHFGAPFCDLLHENGMFGVTVSKEGMASCKELGLRGLDPNVLGNAIAGNEEMLQRFHKTMRITGSYTLEDMLSERRANA